MSQSDEYTMTPGQTARFFQVSPSTVWRWTVIGLLSAQKTPGGQRRYSRAECERIMAESQTGDSREPA